MIAHFTVAFAALFVSCLTFYSGFGLGTMLMPVFALFFPVQSAVAATAMVHGANNLLKVFVVGKHADRSVVLRFGLPAMLAAVAGAAALGYAARFAPVATYTVGSFPAAITPLKLLIAGLMVIFALFELVPKLSSLRIDRKYLVLGGLLSGFFGGFSGNQGALRATFLTKMDLSTEAFVGSNAIIAFMVDVARISVYGAVFWLSPATAGLAAGQAPLIITGGIAAFAGTLLGKQFLHTITMNSVKHLTGALLLLIAALLGSGLM